MCVCMYAHVCVCACARIGGLRRAGNGAAVQSAATEISIQKKSPQAVLMTAQRLSSIHFN